MTPRCPACEGSRDAVFVEERRDPVGGVLYRLHRCGACGVVFSDPRDPVGPDWYEKAAPLRAAETRSAPTTDARFSWFLGRGLTPGRLLDVGCGGGGFLAEAGARGWKATGVDYEERMIALARERGLDAHAADLGDFLKTRAAKEFDAVTLFDVLEHSPEPRALLASLKPVLKRGGHLAVTFPNAGRPAWFGRESFDYPPHHFTRWDSAALTDFLRREGFAVVETRTPGPTVRWFSEVMFYGLIAPAAVSAVRRVLFGPESRGTLTDLYAAGAAVPSAAPPDGLKGFLADPAHRRRAANTFKYACRLVTYPAGALLALACRLRKGSGEYLYCLARYDA